MKVSSLASLTAGLLLVGAFSACGQGSGSGFDFGDAGTPGTRDSGYGSSSSGSGSTSSSTSSSSGSSTSSTSSGSSSGGEEDSGTEDSSSSSSGGGTCGSCTTDSECQTACPPVQGGGTNCCDVGSGVCYATTQTTCPTPSDGGTE
ncbi:MAG: hypothetical protein ABSE49_36450 [Polyangiaceae bacterium]